MFYINIIDNSLFGIIFTCPFETEVAFEGGNKYLRLNIKYIDGWIDVGRDFRSYSTVF